MTCNVAAPYRPIDAYIHLPAIWIEDHPPKQSDIAWPRMLDIVLRRRLAYGFGVTVTREGIIAFDFTGTDLDHGPLEMDRVSMFENPAPFARMQARAEALTFHAACLVQARADTAGGAHGFHVLPVTTSRMIHFDRGMKNPACFDQTIWHCISQREGSRTRGHFASVIPTWAEAPAEWVSTSTISRSFDIFDQLYTREQRQTVRAVGLLLQATEHLGRNELPQAFAVAWMVIEHFIARRWDQHVEACEAGRSSPEVASYIRSLRSRPRLYDKLTGLLTAERNVGEYTRTMQLRELRNDLVHDLAPITGPEAADCVNLGVELLRVVHGMDLHIGGGFGYAL
jgi:hypothetical protein